MVDEEELFHRAMHGVRRLEKKGRVEPARGKRTTLSPAAKVAWAKPSPHAGPSAAAPWVLRADGVASERLRRLAAGRPPVEVELDLHGMTRDEALAALDAAFARAVGDGVRVLAIVHGRGLHSRQGKAVLKKAVYDWLAHGAFAGWVLAAVPKPGSGGGCCLVLLRRRR